MDKLKKKISEIGQVSFSKKIGAKPQQVWNWLNRDNRIPSEYVMKTEEATGIPCWEIRPDLYPPERFAA